MNIPNCCEKCRNKDGYNMCMNNSCECHKQLASTPAKERYEDGCLVEICAGDGHTFLPGCEKYNADAMPSMLAQDGDKRHDVGNGEHWLYCKKCGRGASDGEELAKDDCPGGDYESTRAKIAYKEKWWAVQVESLGEIPGRPYIKDAIRGIIREAESRAIERTLAEAREVVVGMKVVGVPNGLSDRYPRSSAYNQACDDIARVLEAKKK